MDWYIEGSVGQWIGRSVDRWIIIIITIIIIIIIIIIINFIYGSIFV